jgi:F0F1-type ATP synthase membrane subunit a
MGLVPAFASATGNVNVTAALALITLGFMIFGTIQERRGRLLQMPSSRTASRGRC